jgi:hypothetical protein
VAQDPDDENRRLVLTVKMNIAEKPAGIAFSICNGTVVWDNKPVTVDLADVLAPCRESRSKLEAARLFLEGMLASGPMPEVEIEERASLEGISAATLRRAKKALGVKPQKRGVLGGWWWSLPTAGRANVEDAQTPSPQDLSAFEEVQDEHIRSCSSSADGKDEHLRGQDLRELLADLGDFDYLPHV